MTAFFAQDREARTKKSQKKDREVGAITWPAPIASGLALRGRRQQGGGAMGYQASQHSSACR